MQWGPREGSDSLFLEGLEMLLAIRSLNVAVAGVKLASSRSDEQFGTC